MAFFGIEVKPGNPYTHRSEKSKGRLLISMASLGLGTATSKSVLQCKIGNGSPRSLCSLFPESLESFQLNFELYEVDKEIIFSVIGPRSVHISGYYPNPSRNEEEQESCVLDRSDDEPETSSNSSALKSGDESRDKKNPNKKKLESAEENSAAKNQSPSNNASSKNVEEDDKKINDAKASNVRDEKKPKKKNKIESAEENSAAKTESQVEENNCPSKDVEDDKKTNDAEGSKIRDEKKPKKKKIKSAEENSTAKSRSPVEENNASAMDVEDDEKTNAKASNIRTLRSGLIIEELKPGKSDGKVAISGKEISVRYVCKLKSTGRVVDSNILHNLLKFRLGARKVTEGWEDGLEGMRVGEKRKLTVPPLVGAIGAVENVPRDSWLVYEVELVKVKG